jgi:O-antigen ligase
MQRLLLVLSWLAVVTGLVLPTILPEVGNVTILVLMGVGLLLVGLEPRSRSALREPGIGTMMGAGLVLLLALAITARSVDHILGFFFLSPLWFSGLLLALVHRLEGKLNQTVVGFLALAGTALAVAVTAYDVYVLGLRRGGWTVNNPIHLADLALMLGFASLVALYGASRWRWIALLGPVLALIAIMLSGSRGPLIAFGAVAVVAALFLVFTLWRGHRLVPWLAVVLVVAGVAIGPFIEVQLGARTFSVVALVDDFVDGGPSDDSTSQRVYMLRSAWGAFQASPIFGHGMIRYTHIAAQYGPADNPFRPSGHLHNDIADFAVIGGLLGLLSYILILLAPLAASLGISRQRRAPILFLGLAMSVGYLFMGFTNAMIGILTQTVLYGVLLALLSHFAMQARDAEQGKQVA